MCCVCISTSKTIKIFRTWSNVRANGKENRSTEEMDELTQTK